MAISAEQLVLEVLREAMQPTPDITVSQWADQFRMLSPKASSEHGPWRTSRTPYLREPMDAFSANSGTQEIVLVFASQTGKSEACNNCIGYALDVAPGPVLMVQPTLDLAKRYSKMRLAPMIESTPRLSELVLPARSRDSGNTLLMKEFLNDALLIVGGANAASGLASMPIRYAIEDEQDRFPLDVDGEGAPTDLIDARTRTFGARRKRLKTSTPTLVGRSRIWWEWERSDQRRYQVPCPHCGHYQVLAWEMMRYDPNDPALAHGRLSQPPVMICGACGTGIEERAKSWWYGEDLGRWVAENPESPVAGFHLPGFYSPLGWLSWTEIVVGYEKAKDDPTKLKPWTNTVRAECWADAGDAPDWEALYRRREPYRRGVVPMGGVVLTAGVDCQRDRLELEVVAWGPGLESWSVDYVVLPGNPAIIQTDPSVPCVWRDLERELNRIYPHEGGGQLAISMTAVDSGDNTNTVYTWVRSQHSPRIRAIKGRGTLTSPVGLAKMQEINYRGQRAKKGVKLWPVGVDLLKQELYGWLRQPAPLNPGDPMPRGFCHFPEYGEEYFRGLTAEELQSREHKGFTVYEWVKVYARNEPLDCRVYNRASAWMLGLDRLSQEEWDRRRALLIAKPEGEEESKPRDPTPPGGPVAVARPRRRRRVRSATIG